MQIVKLVNVCKSYGKKNVVKSIHISIEKGELFGLLGPNGAGKSTTISMLSGLVSPTSGTIYINEKDIKKYPKIGKQYIGLVPQDIALYPTLSAQENLIFWGRMYGLSGREIKKRVDEVLEIVKLTDRRKSIIQDFSGGMKRRINIAAALLHSPQILIMDEPTVGIDPQSRNNILETVKELNNNGKGMTVIYTSHYMEEVEFLCKRVGIMDEGNVLAIGDKEKLKYQAMESESIEIAVSKMNQDVLNSFKQIDGIKKTQYKEETKKLILYLNKATESMALVISTLSSNNIGIQQIRIKEPNLENVFLQLTGKELRD